MELKTQTQDNKSKQHSGPVPVSKTDLPDGTATWS